MNKKELRGGILLLIAAVLWGSAFVAQSVGMDYIGPFTYLFARSVVGSLFLIPVAVIYEKRVYRKEHPNENQTEETRKAYRKTLLIGGLCCGMILTVASAFQQYGIIYTTVGKAGFITALYIVIVPIMGLFLKKKCGINVWISVVIAVVGLYLLCMTGSFSLSKGDSLILICAFLYAGHIMIIDHFSPKVNGVMLSLFQFTFCAIICGILMLIFEHPTMSSMFAAWGSILYAGILSSGVAYTCQIVGQKDLNPTVASLIMSLESVMSVLSGWLVLNQKLTIRELIGCIIMFAAILLAQIKLPSKKQISTEH